MKQSKHYVNKFSALGFRTLFIAMKVLSQEEYDQFLKQIELVKSNYERIAYIMMLLNKPNKKDKQDADMYQKWYNELAFASKEAIMDENKDVLKELKEYIKKGKENG